MPGGFRVQGASDVNPFAIFRRLRARYDAACIKLEASAAESEAKVRRLRGDIEEARAARDRGQALIARADTILAEEEGRRTR
jgi:hypothetical protein